MSEKLGMTAWICMWSGGSLESSASFQQIKNETKCLPRPSFGEVSSASFDGNQIFAMPLLL